MKPGSASTASQRLPPCDPAETRTAWVEPAGDGVVLGFDGVLLDIPDPVRLAVGLDVGAIHVDVYSGDGGSAFAAAELVGLLTARALAGVRVTAHVRGQAASAHAELIALVPGKRSMAASARLMLHAPRMPALLGSEDELRQAAEVLAATRSLMAERLARRARTAARGGERLAGQGTDGFPRRTLLPAGWWTS